MAVPTANYATTYNENGLAWLSPAGRAFTDDGTNLASARIVLTNAQPGDVLAVGTLPGPIDSDIDITVDGQITVLLTGVATLPQYQAAIQAVTFASTSENPATVARTIQTTVNDGFVESDPVTTTVNVIPVNDAPAGNNDTVITNVGAGVTFSIAQTALLANDTDPELGIDDHRPAQFDWSQCGSRPRGRRDQRR